MLGINWRHLDSLVQPSFWDRPLLRRQETQLNNYGHSEDAMRALSATQQQALDSICTQYPHTRTALDNTLDHLTAYLLGKTPLAENYVSGLTEAQKQVYYRDIYHTAYRCLIQLFNPWISPTARYAKRGWGGARTDFSQAQRETIAAIWKALDDENFPLDASYTRARAKELFAETLSDIGRTHNRDNNAKIDDMKADSPSCQAGINQRLVQFIMIASQQKVLDPDLMKQKFQEHFISENQDRRMTVFNKIEQLDLATLSHMKEALDNLVVNLENTPEDKQLLSQLFPWTTHDLAAFIDECKAYYGDDPFTRRLSPAVCFQEKRFDNFGCLILGLARDPLSAYYEEIRIKIESKIERLSQEPEAEPEPEIATGVDAELEALREKLITLLIEENQETLIYELLDGTPERVKQIGRERGILLVEEEREKQIQLAIQERNETLVYQLLDGSPDFVRQIASQRQARQEAQQDTAANRLERLREELINVALEQGYSSILVNQLLDGTPDFIVNYARQVQERNISVEYMDVEEDNTIAPLPMISRRGIMV